MRLTSESSGEDFHPIRKTRGKGKKQIGSGRLRWDRLYQTEHFRILSLLFIAPGRQTGGPKYTRRDVN